MKISVLLRAIVLSVLLLSWSGADLQAADMSRLIDADCTRCHSKVIKEFKQFAAAHATDIECRGCHLQHPRQRGAEFAIAACSICHDPQDNKHFAAADCGDCHNAHKPLEIDFAQFDKPIKQICLSCHENPYVTTSAHAEALRCNQCHPQHAAIPNCSDCHDGHTGGKIQEACLSCHSAHNPTPTIAAEGLSAKTCTVCHAQTKKLFTESGGAHAEQSCDDCHVAHTESPDCTECHEGHNEKMVGADCQTCHSYHLPMPPVFTAETNSTFCVDCHAEPSELFTKSGGAHQQNLACADCHTTHPPTAGSPEKCSSCHEPDDNAHFTFDNCQQCHNPHSPKVGDFGGVADAQSLCSGCHTDVAKQMAKQPTAHSSDLTCVQCHEAHDHVPSCLDCHDTHDKKMQAADCAQCHDHHSPRPVAFRGEFTLNACIGCHQETVDLIDAGGQGHKSQISCVDCHQDHPPGENVIPECASCHDSADNPHFASDACIDCHNPHQPIKDDLSGMRGHRPVCAGCHQQAEEQLSDYAGAHDRDCVSCHRRHTGVPSCLGCHDGHNDSAVNADCTVCHQAHTPLQIGLQQNPPVQLCADCHESVVETVKSSGASHRDNLLCTSCHQQHPDASCSSCHSEHPQQGQALPDSCFGCHAPSDQTHFTVGECQQCHSPHEPLVLNLKGFDPQAPVCVSCHTQVAEQFTALPSAHSEQDCANCHSEHTRFRLCLDCHQPHEKSMQQADCLSCHPPHQPQNIKLQRVEEIPQIFCASCHEDQASAFAAKGAAHQQEFASCTACHPEHLPNGETTTATCNSCHARAKRRHFVVEDCASCHDPHQPLELQLDKLPKLKPICLSCHNNQERLHNQFPNKHTEFDCRKCHAGEHGSTMDCQDCHQPHIPEMTQTECLKCHSAHLPQLIKAKPGQVGPVCVSCHQQAAGTLKKLGTAHKKQPCVSCHQSHPPNGKKVMPNCAICHDEGDQPHFAVANCQGCHSGHQPLGHDLSKAENANPACLSCHQDSAEIFVSAPSAHAEQGCNSCHPQHGAALKCADCHDPHQQGQSYADCLNCHSAPHAPKQIAFAGDLPAAFCQSCHADQVAGLAASKAAHNSLSCIECHSGDHGSMLDCASCHEPPHDPGLHSKFPNCLKCHIDPHDLADWRGGDSGTTVPPAPQPTQESITPVNPDEVPAAPEAARSEGVK